MIDIESLELESGRCPVREFLDSLGKKSVAKIEKLTELLRQRGFLAFPLGRKLEGYSNLWEMRLKSQGLTIRVFYAYAGKNRAVLISGFAKKSQKTPARELERAANLLRLYGVQP